MMEQGDGDRPRPPERPRAQGRLSLLEAEDYSGVVSSHTWSTPDVNPRIYKLGGVITPYAGSSPGFVEAWKKTKPTRDPRYYFGFGYGADMNGFGAQGHPREGAPNPVQYPFKSFDGGVTFQRQRSGVREFDINTDGVAHYGLYPDWVEDLRKIAGDQIVKDMARGAEAYLQMWERAAGVPRTHCLTPKAGFKATRLPAPAARRAAARRAHAGGPAAAPHPRLDLLRQGQEEPQGEGRDASSRRQPARSGSWRARPGSTRAGGIGRGARASRLRGTKRLGRGLRVRRFGRRGAKLVYGVRARPGALRRGGLAPVARSPKRLRAHLRLARVR